MGTMDKSKPLERVVDFDAVRKRRAESAVAASKRTTIPAPAKRFSRPSPSPEWSDEAVTGVEAERPVFPPPPRLPRT